MCGRDVGGPIGVVPCLTGRELADQLLLAPMSGSTIGWCVGRRLEPDNPVVGVGGGWWPDVDVQRAGWCEVVVQPAPVGDGERFLRRGRACGE